MRAIRTRLFAVRTPLASICRGFALRQAALGLQEIDNKSEVYRQTFASRRKVDRKSKAYNQSDCLVQLLGSLSIVGVVG